MRLRHVSWCAGQIPDRRAWVACRTRRGVPLASFANRLPFGGGCAMLPASLDRVMWG